MFLMRNALQVLAMAHKSIGEAVASLDDEDMTETLEKALEETSKSYTNSGRRAAYTHSLLAALYVQVNI